MKIFLISAAILIGHLISFAQAPNWGWAKAAGGSDFDHVDDICSDANGNVFITGSYYSSPGSFGSTTLPNAGMNDIFIAKYDVAGNLLWARNAGGSSYDSGLGISCDKNGNVIVVGEFASSTIKFDTTNLINASSQPDFFVVKYDTNGKVLWAKSGGGSASEYAQGVAVDPSGNILITGYFMSTKLVLGATTLSNAGSQDIFLAKYDGAGNVLWATSAGSNYPESGQRVTCDANGNVFVTGSFYSATLSFGSTVLTNNSTGFNTDIFLAKYDASGSILWAKSAGSTAFEDGWAVACDALGNAYITGDYKSNSITFGATTLTNTAINTFDIFLVKYTSGGNVSWAKNIGGTDSDVGKGIQVDATGNILLAGYFSSPSVVFGNDTVKITGASSFTDVFVAKLDTSGKPLWVKSTGGNSNDFGFGVTSDPLNNIFVTATFYDPTINVGPFSIANLSPGDADIFIAKLDHLTGIEEKSNPTDAINIFPNPSSGKFYFNTENIYSQLRVYNMFGQCIHSQTSASKRIATMDLSEFPNGLYTIILTDQQNCYSKTVVIQ